MKIQVKREGRTYKVEGACIDIEFLVLGPIANNTFIISDDSSVIVVDPSADAPRIVNALGGRKLDAIFITHHHEDHTAALKELKDLTGAPVYASRIDTPIIENQPNKTGYIYAESCPVDHQLNDKDVVKIGSMRWKVIHTPGHTPGSICFFLASEDGTYIERPNVLVSGDTLFCASIGRTDFPGGNMGQMRASLKRLSKLPDDTLVLPGHESLTTIGTEQNRVFRYYC